MVPSGSGVVLLYSNITWRAEYAEIFGLKRHLRREFKVKVSCSRNNPTLKPDIWDQMNRYI